MGEVYRARDTRLDREVAIKVLPERLASDAERLKRFAKEARSASALNHPSIVTVYDIGETDGVSWIAMELVEGKTLRELLVSGPLPVKRALQIGAAVAEGLARAHEAGIVHRDLKPENVMVGKDGLVKILDFGLAKRRVSPAGQDETSTPTETGTQAGVVLGTVGYMSPEQVSGEEIDYRSDQFSFGAVLYELLTGRRAFQKSTAVDTMSAILHEEPEPIAQRVPQAPAPVRWVVERCLAKEPEDRYVATRDLARDLVTLRDRLTEAGSGEALIATPSRPRFGVWKTLGVATLIALSLLAGRLIWRPPSPSQPSFQRLTFRRGFVDAARFSSDGQTIVYSARWDGKPPHVFLTRPDGPESQKLELPDASLMSLSAQGELALVTGKKDLAYGWLFSGGTLASVPMAGGTPREVAEDVWFTDWAPDGKQMLVARGDRLEFPLGKVIRTMGVFHPRISPTGDRIAFNYDRRVHVTDLSGKELLTSRPVGGLQSLAWSPSGEEVWFTTGYWGTGILQALGASGKERVLLRMPRSITLEDVSRDGKLLMGLHSPRGEVWALPAGETFERDLTVLGSANAMGISLDGKTLLVNESSPQRGNVFYACRADGSPPKKLGEGFASELSADAKWAAVVRSGPPAQLVLVPTGAGGERLLERGVIEEYSNDSVRWSQNGRRLTFGAHEKGHGWRMFVQEVAGGVPRPVTPEGMDAQTTSISPDGRFVIVQTGKDFWIYSTDGGERRLVKGFLPTDYIWRNWSEDGRFAYAWNVFELPYRVFRVDLTTGRREPWKTIMPQDPAGIWTADLMLTPDGKSYAYNCHRDLSDLFLVTGVR
jgi:serine/threonine protein kinase